MLKRIISSEDFKQAVLELNRRKLFGAYRFNTDILIYKDGDLSLGLEINSHDLGICGISNGLEGYYNPFYLNFIPSVLKISDFPEYHPALHYTQNRWGITQMQAISCSRELRSQINFRKILLQGWEYLSQQLGISIEFYLSAQMVTWKVPFIEEAFLVMGRNPAPQNVFLMNYDYTAKRHKFVYDPNLKIFVKNRIQTNA